MFFTFLAKCFEFVEKEVTFVARFGCDDSSGRICNRKL